MGPDYVSAWLMAIVSLGTLPSLLQEPAWSVLSGMNRHGPLAAARLTGSLCAVLLLWLTLTFSRGDLRIIAAALLSPVAVVDALVVPLLVCRSFRFPFRQYFADTWGRPLIYVSPYMVTLSLGRWYFDGERFGSMLALSVAAPLLGTTYWFVFRRPQLRAASAPVQHSIL
jgi:O-antigen/teichoic acid export membrane protein